MMFKGKGMKVKTSKPEQNFFRIKVYVLCQRITGQTRENEHRESEL